MAGTTKTPYQLAMEKQQQMFGMTLEQAGQLKGQNASLLQQLKSQQQGGALPSSQASTFQPITNLKPTDASVSAFQKVYDAYIGQLAGEKQKALQGVQGIYAGRGVTGSGEEATALGETSGQYGYAQANMLAQLAQQAASEGLSLAQYNQKMGLDIGQLLGNIGGAPTLAATGQQADIANQQFNQGITQAGLTGQYQGAPTIDYQKYLQELTGQTPASMFTGTPYEQYAQAQLPTLTQAEQTALNIYAKSPQSAAIEMGQATLDSALAKQKQIQGGMITTPGQVTTNLENTLLQKQIESETKLTDIYGKDITEAEEGKATQTLLNENFSSANTGMDIAQLDTFKNNIQMQFPDLIDDIVLGNVSVETNTYQSQLAWNNLKTQPGKTLIKADRKTGTIEKIYYNRNGTILVWEPGKAKGGL